MKSTTKTGKSSKKENLTIDDFELDNDYIDELDDTTELYFDINKYTNELRDIFGKANNKNTYRDDVKQQESIDEAVERLKLDSEAIHTFTEGIKEDRELKKGYAKNLIEIFKWQLMIFNIIFILSGLGILKYTDVTLNIFVAGCVIEVIAIVKIIVSYLFNDNTSQSLKNILEKNKIKKD